ncbi:MAG: GIY-YIG nuclease family protein [Microcella pacifica]|uniref:GIY-YIG nuclease family protein n=1 Tax=Microcella pacifica TaxID=2591847 RepID=A0A9E5JVE2_9MICO|nr:GIY-YIG nuclease family protein [Microcella pacifica]NHF63103.1 GIY-YIG nuclease family protein [Microcella pacifica]
MPEDPPIFLNDVLHLSAEDLDRHHYRVRLTFRWGNDEQSDPIARYRRDPEDALGHLLYYRPQSTFKVGQRVIGMTKIRDTQWLLTRIVQITGITEQPGGRKAYESADVGEYRGLFGRVILRYSNPPSAQNEVRVASKILPQIQVDEVRATGFGDDGFPGYANVTVSWHKLHEIVSRSYESWHTALRNMKGIYLIVDKSNGAAYVGKADGSQMLWARWANYARTRHGGNVELKKLDAAHIEEHFQWSILEVMDEKTQDDYVNARESWWKSALSTRGQGGLNRN